MKKIFIIIILLVLIIFSYYYMNYQKDNKSNILDDTEEETFDVNKYVIFGTHFNISGCINKKLSNNTYLILKNNKEEIIIESIFTADNNTCFNTSDKNNEGINLEELKQANYFLLVKEVIDKDTKYYRLENKTEYGDLTYYTITKNNKNKKIDIKFLNNKDKNYMEININSTTLPSDVYDITIDPGHGGNDPGTSYKYNGKVYTESDITLKICLLLKKELEKLGLKVKLTRESDETISNYGGDGRAVIPNKTKSKYSLSIHINSYQGTMNYGGVEIYTPNNISYSFATLLADNISEIVGYSKKQTYKLFNGVYYKYFTYEDISHARQDMIKQNLEPYNIKDGCTYMFMIREVGGISTYAYVDGRSEKHGYNEYYNSNQTAEPYLLELGYINYNNDLENLSQKPELFAKAIKDAIKEYLNIS